MGCENRICDLQRDKTNVSLSHAQAEAVEADGQDDVKRGISNAKQSFVLHMVEPVKTHELLGRSLGILFVDSLTLTEIFSDLILRPLFPAV